MGIMFPLLLVGWWSFGVSEQRGSIRHDEHSDSELAGAHGVIGAGLRVWRH